MPCAFRLRRFEREWLRAKPPHLRLMFNSAVRTLEPHWLAPDAGQGRVGGPRFTISLKRSTLNLQLSTSRQADYPIFRSGAATTASVVDHPAAQQPPYSHGYLYFGCQPAAPLGMRSKKCQTLQKSSPGENGASDTRTIPNFWRRNTETPGIQPPS